MAIQLASRGATVSNDPLIKRRRRYPRNAGSQAMGIATTTVTSLMATVAPPSLPNVPIPARARMQRRPTPPRAPVGRTVLPARLCAGDRLGSSHRARPGLTPWIAVPVCIAVYAVTTLAVGLLRPEDVRGLEQLLARELGAVSASAQVKGMHDVLIRTLGPSNGRWCRVGFWRQLEPGSCTGEL
jgi:hypothetical protein